jgi:signal transduction histidine kinase
LATVKAGTAVTCSTTQTPRRPAIALLAGNAMKFTSQGSVTLRTRLVRGWDDERVAFDVEDAGIGINASQPERIFEPFVQADDPIHGRPGGTGRRPNSTRS